jgi:hypothetical protein
MRPSRVLKLSLLLTTVAFVTTVQAFGGARIQTFGVPGASFTYANGVNLSGAVVSSFYDSQFVSHGFLRSPAGGFTTFDVPGAYTGDGDGTFAWAINDAGEIAGRYSTGPTSFQGFLRDAAGNVTTFEVPGEALGNFPSTMGMNDAGQIAGLSYGTTTADIFIRDTDGSFTVFSPGGNAAYVGVNSLGEVAGTYVDTTSGTGVLQGFVRDASGNLTTFAVPGATGTWAYTINKAGVVAGFWLDANSIGHGYLRSPSGLIQSYDAPKGTGTTLGGAPFINDDGVVASTAYNASNNAFEPFIRNRAGDFTIFSVSGSKTAIINGVNNNSQVCGTFLGQKGVAYGFLRTP